MGVAPDPRRMHERSGVGVSAVDAGTARNDYGVRAHPTLPARPRACFRGDPASAAIRPAPTGQIMLIDLRSHRRAGLSRGVALVSLLLAAAACGDRGDPVTVPPPVPVAPRSPALLAAVQCTADRRAASLRCGQGALPAAARGYVIVGGQHQYVELTSSNSAYNAGTGAFTFDVSVQNLIPQPLGTTDGTTPDPSGVRVVFHSGPTVTAGTGTVTVAGDGVGTFTAAGQPYYQYAGASLGADGILSPNEPSADRTWTLSMPASVTTFTFQLYVVAEVPYPNGYVDVTPAADTLAQGGTASLTATVRSVVGNTVPGQTVTWSTSNAAVATVDASGVVTAVGPGAVSITATAGARTGAAALQVCPSLAVGGVYVSADAKLCLGTGGAAAEYTVTPVNLGVSDLSFSITGAGIVPVTGPPSPVRLPGLPTPAISGRLLPDASLHLREMEEDRAAAAALRGGLVTRGQLRRNIVPGVPTVGTVMNLNVDEGYCSPVDIRASTVKSVGVHVIVMEDNANPAGGFSTAQYDSIAAAFDTLVYPAVAGNFGAPFDIDANSRIIALYTAAVNDLTPAASPTYVAARFRTRDLYTTTTCAGSNQGEMLYMLAPDPAGAHGNVRSAAFVRSVTVRALAHEFEHLINASRRTYGATGPSPFEQVWLDEGLAHVAEEETYFASSLHGPGENLGAAAISASPAQTDRFFEYLYPNLCGAAAVAGAARARRARSRMPTATPSVAPPGASCATRPTGRAASSRTCGAGWRPAPTRG